MWLGVSSLCIVMVLELSKNGIFYFAANNMISADFEPHACRLTMFMCIMLVFGPINMTLEGVYAKAQPCGSIRSFHIDVSNIDYIILCKT